MRAALLALLLAAAPLASAAEPGDVASRFLTRVTVESAHLAFEREARERGWPEGAVSCVLEVDRAPLEAAIRRQLVAELTPDELRRLDAHLATPAAEKEWAAGRNLLRDVAGLPPLEAASLTDDERAAVDAFHADPVSVRMMEAIGAMDGQLKGEIVGAMKAQLARCVP